MKALIKKSPEKGIWLEDIPNPEVDTNDVLIRIQKTAICGTDLHIINGMNGQREPLKLHWLPDMNSRELFRKLDRG